MDYYHAKINAVPDDKLKTASKRQYKDKLRLLSANFGKDVDYILTHADETFVWICETYPEEKDIHMRKAFVQCIICLYKHIPDLKEKDTKQFKLWKGYAEGVSEAAKKKQMSNEISDAQKKGWVEWDKIIEMRDQLANTEYGSPSHLLLSCYTYIPPLRADWGCVRVLTKAPTKKGDKLTGNYLLLTQRTAKLILNDYKTSKSYGRVEIPIPAELRKVIQASIQASTKRQQEAKAKDNLGKPDDKQAPFQTYLFTNADSMRWASNNSFTSWCCKRFKEMFNTNLNLTLLRHIYTSRPEVKNMTVYEREKLAREGMLHSYLLSNCYEVKTGSEASETASTAGSE